jgi:ribonuclease P protein component
MAFPSTKKQALRLAFGVRAGRASVRNRAKRYARDLFRSMQPRLPAAIEIVLAARAPLGDLTRRQLRGEMAELFERARAACCREARTGPQ